MAFSILSTAFSAPFLREPMMASASLKSRMGATGIRSTRLRYWVNTAWMFFSESPTHLLFICGTSTRSTPRPVLRAIWYTVSVLPVPGPP